MGLEIFESEVRRGQFLQGAATVGTRLLLFGHSYAPEMLRPLFIEQLPWVKRLQTLQAFPGELPIDTMVSAIGDVMRHLPVQYRSEPLGDDIMETYAEIMLPLGRHQLVINHCWVDERSCSYGTATLRFLPDGREDDDVKVFMDDINEETGLSRTSHILKLIKMHKLPLDQEDDYINLLGKEGFYGFSESNKRVVLEAIRQSLTSGGRSNYGELVLKKVLRMDELEAFAADKFAQTTGLQSTTDSRTLPTIQQPRASYSHEKSKSMTDTIISRRDFLAGRWYQ